MTNKEKLICNGTETKFEYSGKMKEGILTWNAEENKIQKFGKDEKKKIFCKRKQK